MKTRSVTRETVGIASIGEILERPLVADDSIMRNDQGFVLTGQEVALLPVWKEPRPPCTVETSLPGVFAAGDCRSGSPKRVAFAIGDGATAVTSVHKFLDGRNSEPKSGEFIP